VRSVSSSTTRSDSWASSSSPSRKARGRRRFPRWLLPLVFALGLFIGTENRFQLLRLRALEIRPPGAVPEASLWSALPQSVLRFWPAFLWEAERFRRGIESFYPVRASVGLVGFGKLRISLEPLRPEVLVFWRKAYWFVSTDGRIWRANLRANARFSNMGLPRTPLVVWMDSGPPLFEFGRLEGDVLDSAFPIRQVRGWFDGLKRIGWLGRTRALQIKRIGGRTAVLITLTVSGGEARVVLGEDPAQWGKIAGAVGEIGLRIPGGLSGLWIDTTYRDKIVVRSADRKPGLP